MSFFNTGPRDAPLTRSRRAAILANAPLTASLTAVEMEKLLGASSLVTCPGGTVLFTGGDCPQRIFLIGSGTVQIRVRAGGLAEAAEAPSMHLRLLGPGDPVGDRELASLAAGTVGKAPRRLAAIVLGSPAEIMGLDQGALAAVLAENPGARERMADEVAAQLDALERLADELAGLKNLGKVRLARLLLGFFAHMGVQRGGAVFIPHPFSHTEIAAMLGLTRRSVADDMLALEAFDAIDHDRNGHLVLRDRFRLARIASLDPSADRETSAAAWRADVENALAAGDTLRGFELAREARLYHPRDPELGYSAALAALRAGDPDSAERLIATFDFSNAPKTDERLAALAARALKERAFSAPDQPSLRSLALKSAQAYHAVHRRTQGRYSALNAASMYCVAGDTRSGTALARTLLSHGWDRDDYWSLATQAEAFWLLGEAKAAAEKLRQALGAADADDGKIAITRGQIGLLAACLGRDASPLTAVFPIRKILVCAEPPPKEQRMELDGAPWAAQFLTVTDPADFAHYALWKNIEGAEFVLAAPAEFLARSMPKEASRMMARGIYHLAHPATGPVSPARCHHARRRALGLGRLAAAAAATKITLWPHPPKADDWPDWAAPDALAEGHAAVLWVQSETEIPISDLIADVQAAEADLSAQSALFRFPSIETALAEASRIRLRAAASRRDIRLCLDVEDFSATPLSAALLARMQPLTRAGEIFASDAAASELALLRRTNLRLVAVGRLRNQRRFDRMRAWAVLQVAALA